MTRARPWLLLTAFLLGACASASGIRPDPEAATTSTTQPTTTTATTSAYGGTVVVAVGEGGSPRSLNPFLDGPDTAVLDLIAPAVFARGYDVDPVTLDLVPNVLEAIPSLEDGSVIDLGNGTIQVTATVASGARWADGEPVTGDDLAFTVRVITDPALPIRVDLARRYAGILPESLTAEGSTLTFEMEASTDYQLMFDLIIPKHAVEGSDFATAWNATMWVAGGPFQLASWTPGQTLELSRNERYWRTTAGDTPLPFLDRLIFRFYEPGPAPDPRLLDGFASGSVDVVTLPDTATAASGYAAVEGGSVVAGESLAWEYLSFQFGPANRNEGSLNRHLRFRQAVAHAIDRSALAAGRGTAPLASALAPYGPGYDRTPWDRYPYAPSQAAALMSELGEALGLGLAVGDGPPVVVTVPDDDAATAAIAGQVVTMLRDAGFDAQLQIEDAAVFFGATVDNGSWDVSVGRFIAGPGVARVVAFASIFDPAGLPFVGDNYFRWGTVDSTVSDEATDAYALLVGVLGSVADPAEASRLAEQAEELLADQVVIIPLIYAGRPGFAYRPGELLGPVGNPAEGLLWNVAEWTRQVGAAGR